MGFFCVFLAWGIERTVKALAIFDQKKSGKAKELTDFLRESGGHFRWSDPDVGSQYALRSIAIHEKIKVVLTPPP